MAQPNPNQLPPNHPAPNPLPPNHPAPNQLPPNHPAPNPLPPVPGSPTTLLFRRTAEVMNGRTPNECPLDLVQDIRAQFSGYRRIVVRNLEDLKMALYFTHPTCYIRIEPSSVEEHFRIDGDGVMWYVGSSRASW